MNSVQKKLQFEKPTIEILELEVNTAICSCSAGSDDVQAMAQAVGANLLETGCQKPLFGYCYVASGNLVMTS